ncbi:MAG: hypothetical protein QXD03_01385 [Candidatus Anstonellales archaeon]
MINSAGKVLIFGGYNLLMNKILVNGKYLQSRALVAAVVDRKNMGIGASYMISNENRIISKLYNLYESPDIRSKNLASVAMAVAIKYLKSKRKYTNPLEIELLSSPIFGTPDSKTGLGSSSASMVSTIKAVLEGNGLKPDPDLVFRLAVIAYRLAGKTPVGFDFATATYNSPIIYQKSQNIDLDLKTINKSLRIEIIPVRIPNDVDMLVYDTGYSLDTNIAVREFKRVYKRGDIKDLAREYFKLEDRGIDAFMKGKWGEVGKITEMIRDRLIRIWKHMDLEQEYEPEEVTMIMKELSREKGIIAQRLHGAGRESLMILVDSKMKQNISNLIEQSYPELKRIDAYLIRNKYLNIKPHLKNHVS